MEKNIGTDTAGFPMEFEQHLPDSSRPAESSMHEGLLACDKESGHPVVNDQVEIKNETYNNTSHVGTLAENQSSVLDPPDSIHSNITTTGLNNRSPILSSKKSSTKRQTKLVHGISSKSNVFPESFVNISPKLKMVSKRSAEVKNSNPVPKHEDEDHSAKFSEHPDTDSESSDSDQDAPEEYLSFPGNRGKKMLVDKYHMKRRPKILINHKHSHEFARYLRFMNELEEPLSVRGRQKARDIAQSEMAVEEKGFNFSDEFDPYNDIHAEGIGQVSLETPEQMANDPWCLRILENNHIDQLISSGMTFIEEENRLKKVLLRLEKYFANLGIEAREHEVLHRIRVLILETLECTRCTLKKLELIRKRLLHALEERERLQEILSPYRQTVYEDDHLSP